MFAAFFGAQRQHVPQIFIGHKNGGMNPWLFHHLNMGGVWIVRRVMKLYHAAIIHVHAIHHAGRGGDEVEVEFALEPLLNNFQMQQPKEPATEPKAKRGGAFRFKTEARIVQAQLCQ